MVQFAGTACFNPSDFNFLFYDPSVNFYCKKFQNSVISKELGAIKPIYTTSELRLSVLQRKASKEEVR